MALKDCPECGKSVSVQATACPSCGHPLKKAKKPLVSRPLGFVLQLIAAVLILWGLAYFLDPQGSVTSAILKFAGGAILLYIGGRSKARATS